MSSSSAPNLTWLPIESNPDFLWNCGLPKTWNISDVLGLDPELIGMLNQPVAALLLLFPTNDNIQVLYDERKSLSKEDGPKDLYYMKQTISNACGTVAMIHSIANNMDKIELDDGNLKEFLADTQDDSPAIRAEKLENSQSICSTHDEVAQAGQTAPPSLDDSVEYHFVAFVEKDGHVFELDGRKPGPLDCGAIKESFAISAAEECKKYIACDPENIKFNILALTPSQ
eukprot:maker-scaffold456_size166325-snap-gene-0.24 protein:Tk11176 transcript:maker-scaffold456_size166325-snap-gene-0.24-mRNA-1 annotation:"ubiquitin carboxyl-terminal hydrolase isozyme l3"